MTTATEDLERLRLLGSALAGRDVQVARTAPGEPAWTDGITVFVDATASPSSQVLTLAAQTSMLAAGSLEPGVLRGLRRRHVRRYLAVEGPRALAANAEVLPPWLGSRMGDNKPTAAVEDPVASLALARGTEPLPDPPDHLGTIRVRRILDAAEREDTAGHRSDDTRPRDARDAVPELEPDNGDDGIPGISRVLESPIGGGGPIGRLFQGLFSRTEGRGSGGPPGADAPSRHGGAARRAQTTVIAGRGTRVEETDAPGPRQWTYPEWDVRTKRYRPDWCTVLESGAPTDRHDAMAMPDNLALRRPLSQLGMGLTQCRRRPQGDDIDIDAAVEARVEALAGSTPGEDFYIESLRRRRDLSVLILLDVSGSAAEPGPGGRPVHEHQRRAAAQLTAALDHLGDRVALYAFNSQGRSSVRMMRVKGFDQRLDRGVSQRLGGLAPIAYTRLGTAIRHGTTVVGERGGTSRRLLVVLSDGLAYDHGYERRYGEADARQALAESRRRGVGCVCLSVGAGIEAAALRRVFGTAAHASVPTSDHLPGIIGPLFQSAMRSADAQRRSYQRTERTRERLEIDRSAP